MLCYKQFYAIHSRQRRLRNAGIVICPKIVLSERGHLLDASASNARAVRRSSLREMRLPFITTGTLET